MCWKQAAAATAAACRSVYRDCYREWLSLGLLATLTFISLAIVFGFYHRSASEQHVPPGKKYYNSDMDTVSRLSQTAFYLASVKSPAPMYIPNLS